MSADAQILANRMNARASTESANRRAGLPVTLHDETNPISGRQECRRRAVNGHRVMGIPNKAGACSGFANRGRRPGILSYETNSIPTRLFISVFIRVYPWLNSFFNTWPANRRPGLPIIPYYETNPIPAHPEWRCPARAPPEKPRTSRFQPAYSE